MFAQILATDPNTTQQDIDEFVSFMAPEQAAAFLAEVESHR